MHILLHACCGPCSLEPVRALREEGHTFAIFFSNSNIYPEEEYRKRYETLLRWAKDSNIDVYEDAYLPQEWEAQAGFIGPGSDEESRKRRCRACYHLRLSHAAACVKENGFDALATTLTVSPYQYTDIIEEELRQVCEETGIAFVFRDFRPLYAQAVKRSKERGMYRQNYCGCRFSLAKAQAQREARLAQKREEKARRARVRQAEQAQIAQRKAQRKAYDEKQARKREVLRALREKNKHIGTVSQETGE